MKTTINWIKFQITHVSWIYIIAKRDWEEYRVPYSRSTYTTLKWALRRCEELTK